MVKEVDITVIICTRNRANQLANVLDSACKLVVPSDLHWEFVVVDNGSSDGTVDVVAKYADRLPIRCVIEDTPGLSNARNRGVDEARGDYICWTDDDVVIDPQWLSAYAAAFKRHPEAAVFGGKVIPLLEKPTPAWFEKAKYKWPLNCLLAYRDFGDAIIPLSFKGVFIPWGANFAIRKSDQQRYRYNPELGVSPKHKRVGEETDVIYRAFKAGASGWWVPDSKVNHIIPTKRQTIRYLYDYSFLGGETFAYLRDRFPTDNYLLATGNPPPEYHFNKIQLYFQVIYHSVKLIVASVIRPKSKLGQLSKIGHYMGAASYKKSQ
jgi:glycosyltransferase involved in cell wall biosynthesis